MKKKMMALLVAMTVLFTTCVSGNVFAAQPGEVSDEQSTFEDLESDETGFPTVDLPNVNFNAEGHEHTNEQYSVDLVQGFTAGTESENTDPNNAEEILSQNSKTNTIEANQSRWYYFSLENLSKITVCLNMDETVDADLLMYVLNTETGELINIATSLGEGLGVTEGLLGKLETGIYFIQVNGFEGNGNFTLEYYSSTRDLNYEMNDNPATAVDMDITEKTDITGIIDSPYDVDFYKMTLEEASAVRFELKYTSEKYKLYYYSGNFLYEIKDNLYALDAGTHYFFAVSTDGSYSPTRSYTLNLLDIAPISKDSSARYFSVCDKANIVFQFNGNRTKFYVNGNEIDFTYSYNKSSSSSAGSQSYDISLRRTTNLDVCLFQEEGTSLPLECQQTIPNVVRYLSSSLTGKSNMNVLTLSVFDWNTPCYKIHVRGTGDYSGISLWKDLNIANLFIDPNTGKVIDIEWYNYFYENGSHNISYTSPYTMKYYYPYWNGEEPEGGDE